MRFGGAGMSHTKVATSPAFAHGGTLVRDGRPRLDQTFPVLCG